MNRFFQSIGFLVTIAALIYGAMMLYENYKEVTSTFFQVFGIVTFVGLFGFLIVKRIYGKQWLIKGGSQLYFGGGLIDASKKVIQDVKQRDLKEDTLAEFVAHLIWRITRIGVVGLLIAGLPIWILLNQNQLLKRQNDKMDVQNEKINLQNNLIEADRRGALVILMSNILDQMNQEIQNQKADSDTGDTLSYALSDPLIGRIIALSQGFLPYRYLEDDTLTERALSPERGQLLLTLVNSNLDTNSLNKIVADANFAGALLEEANLEGAYLKGANLTGAKLASANLTAANLDFAEFADSDLSGANLNGAQLHSANLANADLGGADLIGAQLTLANLKDARIDFAQLDEANLHKANLESTFLFQSILTKADLSFANLNYADLFWVKLKEANLSGASFKFTSLAMADFQNTSGINLDSLAQAKTMVYTYNLDEEVERKLRKLEPCLFTEEGCKGNTPISR